MIKVRSSINLPAQRGTPLALYPSGNAQFQPRLLSLTLCPIGTPCLTETAYATQTRALKSRPKRSICDEHGYAEKRVTSR